MSDLVDFYNPHPGQGGAMVGLPAPIKSLVDYLDGKQMELTAVTNLMQRLADELVRKKFWFKAEVSLVDKPDGFTEGTEFACNYIQLILQENKDKYPKHYFRTISYKEIK